MARMTLDEVRDLAETCLQEAGADAANAAAVARTIVKAERDGAHSHGLFRLPGYMRTLRTGKVNGAANPTVHTLAPSVLRVDGDHGMASLAQERACAPLVEMAKAQGVAVCGLVDIYHFAALWPEVEMLAEEGLCAIACTAALPFVAPTGGREALFGTNPLAFAWPRAGGGVYAFDQASSAMARGEVQIAGRDGRQVPKGVVMEADGTPTTDPSVLQRGGVQLPFGGYKGSAIALMVELLAASLIGERFSFEAAKEDTASFGLPVGGEFLLAIDPSKTSGGAGWLAHGEQIFAKIEGMEGARLAGARRHANRAKGGPAEVSDKVLAEIAEVRAQV
jgi:delta1-piperideine-2-carboxylate reductase